MYLLRQYLLTLRDPQGLTRRLGRIEPCCDAAGEPICASGNAAIVFRIRQGGGVRALRCYRMPVPHLREIYGDCFYEKELFLFHTPSSGEWVDVVLTDWIEGETLRRQIDEALLSGDRERLTQLSTAFDAAGAAWIADDWAHGDLKPENIVVDPSGALRLIDWDASFRPEFAGRSTTELGTKAYQHPARTPHDFHAALDDYPVVLIATALHALRIDPTLAQQAPLSEGLLFDPQQIDRDPLLRKVLARFEAAGWPAHYRLARLLLSPSLRLPQAARLLTAARDEVLRDTAGGPHPAAEADDLELFEQEGLWGYRNAGGVVIPPLFDEGFDFTEGLGAVRIGRTWHFVDCTGRPVIHCPGCEAVKPFRNGQAVVVRQGQRLRINRQGLPTGGG